MKEGTFQLLRLMWRASLTVLVMSQIWFVLGNTANFQRGLDLVTTATAIFLFVPAGIFMIISIFLLCRNLKTLANANRGAAACAALMIAAACCFSYGFFTNVKIEGWLVDEVSVERCRNTSDDGRYVYWHEVVNPWQPDSYVRLQLIDLTEKRSFQILLTQAEFHLSPRSYSDDTPWYLLEKKDDGSGYHLSTHPDNVYESRPGEVFDLDMEDKTAVRLYF